MSHTEYAYTTGAVGTPIATFAYAYAEGWKDQLVSFNGQSIAYDQAGNPTSYRGASLSWTRGRLLASYKASGAVASTILAYDANGIRTKKVVPETNYSTTTEYIYSGNNLLQEKVTVGVASQSSTTYRAYIYNSQGVIGFVQGGNTYTYRKNLFGDIVALYQGATKVAEYKYDAYGNCVVIDPTTGLPNTSKEFIGNVNPFRYRGYYWDTDLQLYYLMSRYYDPATGRFINADGLEYLDPETIGGLNLYAYCGNNPVMNTDPSGYSWESFWNSTVGKIVGTVLVIGVIVALSIVTAGIGTSVVGALGGGVWAAVAGGAVGGAISGAIFGAGISMISQGITNGYSNIDYGQVAIEGLIGMASGAVTGALFAGIGRGLGLLGKTKWAQRALDKFDDFSTNHLFGSKSGNFTFFRNGKTFRLEASLQHGLHYHSLKAGTTAAQWKGIFIANNVSAGLIGGIVGNVIY